MKKKMNVKECFVNPGWLYVQFFPAVSDLQMTDKNF